MNILIDLKCLVKQIHSSVATGDHELPFDFFRLDLECSLEVYNGLFKLILLGMVHTKARNNINFSGVISVGLLVVVDSLELILLLLI